MDLLETETARALLDQLLADSRLYRTGKDYRALLDYVPGPYGGAVTLYAAEAGLGPEGVGFWRPLAPASEVVEVGGDHYTLLLPPHLDRLAGEIARRLEAVSADRPEGAA